MPWSDYLIAEEGQGSLFKEVLDAAEKSEMFVYLLQRVSATAKTKITVQVNNSGIPPSASYSLLKKTVMINTSSNTHFEDQLMSIVFELCNAVQEPAFVEAKKELLKGEYRQGQGWLFAKRYEQIEYGTMAMCELVLIDIGRTGPPIPKQRYGDSLGSGFNSYWSKQKHTPHAEHYKDEAERITKKVHRRLKAERIAKKASERREHRIGLIQKFMTDADSNNPLWRETVGLPPDIYKRLEEYYDILMYLRRHPLLVTKDGVQDLSWKASFKQLSGGTQ